MKKNAFYLIIVNWERIDKNNSFTTKQRQQKIQKQRYRQRVHTLY